MKRLITVILILALLLPAAALADEKDVIGCWGAYEILTTGAPSMIMVYLAEDHTCYYVNQMFRPDEPAFGRQYVGTWEMLSNGFVYIKTGNNANMTLMFSNEYVGALDTGTNQLYVNLSKFY